MIAQLDRLREMSILTIALRMALAFLCGGLIGLERENKRRPAGFRTHILICLGACMTTLIGQYLYVYMNYNTDITRMGAQVVAGIGFIGAGTIIVTKRQRVRGLTTAAGLWTSAIVGLACGAAYYEGAITGTALVLLAELVFSKIEYLLTVNSREANLYVRYSETKGIDETVRCLQKTGVEVLDLDIAHVFQDKGTGLCAIFLLRKADPHHQATLEALVQGIDAVQFVAWL